MTSATGVSASTLSRIENGKIPDIDTFLAVCDWLEIPPAEFIKNTEDKGKKMIIPLFVPSYEPMAG